jgi:hypothetical protein
MLLRMPTNKPSEKYPVSGNTELSNSFAMKYVDLFVFMSSENGRNVLNFFECSVRIR